jgi:hypothetical protein
MMDSAAPGSTATSQGSENRRTRRLLVPVLAAVSVIALALAGTFGVLWLQAVDTDPEEVGTYLADASPEVADTASEVATLLLNYDSTNIEQRRSEIVPLTVGRFRQQYEDLLSQGLGAALEDTSATSRGEIQQGPDVSFASPSEAIAIMSTTQTTQSSQNPSGRTFNYVLRLTLIDTPEGGWKVNLFEVLSQQEL